uniref:Beta-glucosidase 13 n=1 Tax=Vitis vinifera TaxID=29760 RepID=A5ACP3_VITVI|nr:hypothetical protein VITISV_000936 [Vitis vinifera]
MEIYTKISEEKYLKESVQKYREAPRNISQVKNGVCEISQTLKRAAKYFRNNKLNSQGCEIGFHLEGSQRSSLRHVSAYAPHSSNTKPSYTTDPYANLLTQRHGIPIGIKAASDWLYIYPSGIRKILLYTKKKYNAPLIYITENGIDEVNNSTLSLKEALVDNLRIYYYYHHLSYLKSAIK